MNKKQGYSGSQISRLHHLRLARKHVSVARLAVSKGRPDIALECILDASEEREKAKTWHPAGSR